MDLSLAKCWDCPISKSDAAAFLIASLLLLFVARTFVRSHLPVLRVLGGLSNVLSPFVFLAGVSAVYRYGVAWSGEVGVTNRNANLCLLGGWFVASVLIWIAAKRLNSRSRKVRGEPGVA